MVVARSSAVLMVPAMAMVHANSAATAARAAIAQVQENLKDVAATALVTVTVIVIAKTGPMVLLVMMMATMIETKVITAKRPKKPKTKLDLSLAPRPHVSRHPTSVGPGSAGTRPSVPFLPVVRFQSGSEPLYVAGRRRRIYTGNEGFRSNLPLLFHSSDARFMHHELLRKLNSRAFFGAKTASCGVLMAAFLLGLLSGTSPAQVTTSRARQLAPGVLTTIPPDLSPDDTVSTHDLVEIRANKGLQWKPEYLAESDTLYGMAANVKFRREVWCLEFAFKPLRMIEVSVPGPTGGTESKLVWYLVYRVRNNGQVLRPVEGEGGIYKAAVAKSGPIRFQPQFILESNDRTAGGERVAKAYLDRVLPSAVAAINQREAPGRRLLNSIEISEYPIPVSDGRIDRSVWGVATWTDVDPRIDFFSVLVGGLTNAYRWEDVPGAYRAGDPPGKGREFTRKMLQLNFWRPGDELQQTEQELRYGVPPGKADLYGVSDGVAYRWVYR
jgi:hypothetical protein